MIIIYNCHFISLEIKYQSYFSPLTNDNILAISLFYIHLDNNKIKIKNVAR